MEIKGYRIKKMIYHGTRSHVFRAVRKEDNSPVIIKTPASEYPDPEQTDRLYNQFDIIKNTNRAIVWRDGKFEIIESHKEK